jgi:ABC-type uncharacterized transport system auxiliary subunit
MPHANGPPLPRFRVVRLAASLGVVAALGCASTASPPDRFYPLLVAAPTVGAGACRVEGVLQVNRPVADATTDQRNLVYQPDPTSAELRRHTFHLFTDVPSLLFQDELASYLRKAGVAPTVVTPDLRARADYALNTRIVTLHRVLGDPARAEIGIELSLVRLRDRKVLVQATESASLLAPDVESAVAAYGAAAGTLFDAFLRDCSRQLGGRSDG